MATLKSTVRRDLPFPKALARAATGDTIVVSSAPAGIENGERFAHMLGVLSIIKDTVLLNNIRVCSTDSAATHGKAYLPFYEFVLIHQVRGITHEFFWMRPTNPESTTQNTNIVPKPAFRIEAKELTIVPIPSGKGLILIQTSLPKKIQLLKKFKFILTTWNWIRPKDVECTWEGEHATYIETPSSVIVGVDVSKPGGTPITRFFRGHGRNRVAVHDHLGATPPSMWATDFEFFYQAEMHDQKVIVSATTGATMYEGIRGQIYATSKALVRHEGSIVEANGQLVTDSFTTDPGPNSDWVLPHAHGLLYQRSGEIRMLVIK